jgi:hypothetical protein
MQGLGMAWRRSALACLVGFGCGGDDSTSVDDTASATGATTMIGTGPGSTSDGATSTGGGATMVDDSGGSTSDGSTCDFLDGQAFVNASVRFRCPEDGA